MGIAVKAAKGCGQNWSCWRCQKHFLGQRSGSKMDCGDGQTHCSVCELKGSNGRMLTMNCMACELWLSNYQNNPDPLKITQQNLLVAIHNLGTCGLHGGNPQCAPKKPSIPAACVLPGSHQTPNLLGSHWPQDLLDATTQHGTWHLEGRPLLTEC